MSTMRTKPHTKPRTKTATVSRAFLGVGEASISATGTVYINTPAFTIFAIPNVMTTTQLQAMRRQREEDIRTHVARARGLGVVPLPVPGLRRLWADRIEYAEGQRRAFLARAEPRTASAKAGR